MAHRHKRKHGGGAEHAGGNPEVFKEAEERKWGGRAKRKDGGAVAVEGKAAPFRPDRVSTHTIAGRKRGGRVGSNLSPLSTAHHDSSAPTEPKSNSTK